MDSLIMLVVVTGVLLVAGAAGVRWLRPWTVALRGGLAAMFVMTGVSHFTSMRAELISMVPAGLPEPELLVSLTGALELAGAAGLLWARTAPLAAACLAALLIVLFRANMYAATQGISSSAGSLVTRGLIQVVYIAAALTIVVTALRARRDRRAAVRQISVSEPA